MDPDLRRLARFQTVAPNPGDRGRPPRGVLEAHHRRRCVHGVHVGVPSEAGARSVGLVRCRPRRGGSDTHEVTHALVVDVDGVVSPVGGHTAWGDDVVAGDVFGPVYTSPTMCARLDRLAEQPGVTCWWLTSWPEQMRTAVAPFPGRAWPAINIEADLPHASRWWKLEALRQWLESHDEVTSLAWCEDHLSAPRAEVTRRWLAQLGVEPMLVAPQTSIGLTPHDLAELETWAARARTT